MQDELFIFLCEFLCVTATSCTYKHVQHRPTTSCFKCSPGPPRRPTEESMSAAAAPATTRISGHDACCAARRGTLAAGLAWLLDSRPHLRRRSIIIIAYGGVAL